MKLTNIDYINILKYYNIYKKNIKKKDIKNIAEKILSDKLCRCIKKTKTKNNNEKLKIAICINSVIKKKNLKIFGFNCKNGYKLKSKKNTNILLTKKGKLFDSKISYKKNKTRKIRK